MFASNVRDLFVISATNLGFRIATQLYIYVPPKGIVSMYEKFDFVKKKSVEDIFFYL